jgi:hypothetical protein
MLNSCARNILVLLISSLSIPYVLKSVMFRRAGVCRERVKPCLMKTFVFWNGHEPVQGQYYFSDRYDLIHFVKLVKQAGL